MVTFGMAKERLTLADMRIARVGGTTEWRVTFAEDDYTKAEANAYYTDDIEDAYLTGVAMRRRRGPVYA